MKIFKDTKEITEQFTSILNKYKDNIANNEFDALFKEMFYAGGTIFIEYLTKSLDGAGINYEQHSLIFDGDKVYIRY